ncbi:hypothetical protein [Undibacterium luofuense]|uniref:Uncharacterized protein n=1 Tax=Undibacterium luofuense TaxID=2828733 RepID=A0A941DJD6_9BURK|nr:hypothetical protein [Undibacterium luofuense]MBR7782072.1 hypothetical protein [Undibacterium luofuense]
MKLMFAPDKVILFLRYCFLTPGQRWYTELIIKFCVLFVLTYSIGFSFFAIGDSSDPNTLSDTHETRSTNFLGFVMLVVISPLIENALMALYCRLCQFFRMNDLLISLSFGFLFGGLHIFLFGWLGIHAILSFSLQAGIYLNWYHSINAYIRTVCFHALWNGTIFLIAVCIERMP